MATGQHRQAAIYQVRARGQLDSRWAKAFGDLRITSDCDGVLILTGPVVDQSALYGLLNRVRCAGLTLLSIYSIVTMEGQ